jgi:hypothetical protein
MAATATVRVDADTRDRLNALAAARGVRASTLLRELVREAEDAQLLSAMNEAFARMHQDPEARDSYYAELREWDAVLLDGLDQGES